MRGFDTRDDCPTCGKPMGATETTWGGKCIGCAGNERMERILRNDEYATEHFPKRITHLAHFHGLTEKTQRDRDEGLFYEQDKDYHRTSFDFNDTVAYTQHGAGAGFTKRSIRGLRRGSMERPDKHHQKYHTEGDVGT